MLSLTNSKNGKKNITIFKDINLDLVSEYGLCPEGQYATAKWNSLELNNSVYFSCGTLK